MPLRVEGAAGLAGLAVVLTVLTGCSPTAPQPLPTASWSGATPSGQLDGDPWVVATRAALEAEAIARNRNDFSLPALTATTGSVLRDRLYQAARDRIGNGQRTDVLPGPTPFGAVEVEASDDGESAVVRGCLASDWASPDGAVPAELESLGVEFRLERGDDGPQLTDSLSLNSLDCDSVELPVSLLVPAPEPSEVGDPAEIVRPESSKG
ncbi:MAG TPA: hypothetical protein VNJ54_03150 [Plantibacter sp.]|uniref:hypothetical protein n=1 Tax=unclassified Plantibacter TaxID=2624265 RepID=UPI002CBBA5EB|nr:hypothetical protein [Plantibacter sp.]